MKIETTQDLIKYLSGFNPNTKVLVRAYDGELKHPPPSIQYVIKVENKIDDTCGDFSECSEDVDNSFESLILY